MQVLLIVEAIPEDTTAYLFDTITDEERANLFACHGKYQGAVNNSNSDPVESWLYEWLATKQDKIVYSTVASWEGSRSPITIEGPCVVIHSGFIL